MNISLKYFTYLNVPLFFLINKFPFCSAYQSVIHPTYFSTHAKDKCILNPAEYFLVITMQLEIFPCANIG